MNETNQDKENFLKEQEEYNKSKEKDDNTLLQKVEKLEVLDI